MIVREAIELHQSMIREARGIPGVKPERWQEALTVRHCALSLVGEPIMYPRINELVRELHNREISTFLVTNAQVTIASYAPCSCVKSPSSNTGVLFLCPCCIIQFPETRSEEHTSELQSLMRISYAVFCLKKKTNTQT